MSPEMVILDINWTGGSIETQSCLSRPKGSSPRSQMRVAMYMFMVFTILMTVCGNLLVIISISHFRQLHSPTNLLILSLACIDWLVGTFVMPYSMIRSVEGCWYFGESFSKIHSGLDIMMSIASLLHLGLISVDRYLAICKPLQYRTSVTMRKVAALIGITWLFSFAFGFGVIISKFDPTIYDFFLKACTGTCILFLHKEMGAMAAIVGFFMPCTVMMALYMKIFLVAKVQARKICSSAMTRAQSDKNNCTFEKREKKAAKTLAIVLGVFLLCWLPFVTVLLVKPLFYFPIPVVLFDAVAWFGYFNSTCNPLIYGFFYPWFRRVFKIIMSGKVYQNGSSSINIYANNC